MTTFLYAQEPVHTKGTYYLGARMEYGFLWAHRPTMSHLVNRHLIGGEISLWKTTNGEKCWHEPFRRPQSGLTFAVIPLGDERLGTAFALFPFVNFPVADAGKHASFDIHLGWGIGWLTNKFDPIENHKNTAIGSHLNACLQLQGLFLFSVTKNIFLETGLGITHFSNGAMTLPNLGLNLPMAEVGFHCRISGDPDAPCLPNTSAKFLHTDSLIRDMHWHLTALLVTGMNDIDPPGGRRYPLCSVLLSATRNTSRKHRFGGGLDLMYSQSLLERMHINEIAATPWQNVQVGAKFTYELVLGRLYLPFEVGFYAWTKWKENGLIYDRLAIRYLVNDHLLVNISLKTHVARAEYWEAGFGWRI